MKDKQELIALAEKVDQDVREAAAQAWAYQSPMSETAFNIRAGEDDGNWVVQAFARMKAAGRQQGLREAAEVVTSMCTRTFAQDDAYTKLFEASEAITALMEGEGK